MIIQPLNDSHDRASFDCGEVSLNLYLQRYARQQDRKGFGRTYVAVKESTDATKVLGYHAIAGGSVAFENLPENVPHYPIPIVRLTRLAVALQARGLRLGELLLMDALRRSSLAAETLGIYAVVVDALNETARDFYLHYRFKELRDDRYHLYLPMKIIRELPL